MRKERLVRIKSDVFDIADRIREVDERYLLFYNLDRSRFEVRLEGRPNEIVITWNNPLDVRLVTKLRETHVRRVKRILEELEKQDLRAKKEEERKIKEKAGECVDAFMNVAWKTR